MMRSPSASSVLRIALPTAILFIGCERPATPPAGSPPPPSPTPAAPPAAPVATPSSEPPPAATTTPVPPAPVLNSARIDKPPGVDGKLDDGVWKAVAPLVVVTRRPLPPDAGSSVEVELRSVHTVTHVYFAVTWKDATRDESHKSWTWNAQTKAYEEGADREDMLALAFEHTGPFEADMFAPVEATWDVWHWKAARTNPQGFAMDKTHRYSRTDPGGKSKRYDARDGKPVFIARPEDAGDSVEKKEPAPERRTKDRLPQYRPGKPTGSAADVRAKGLWVDGRWTLELERKLNTGHPDDTSFDPTRKYKMAIATFDRTGEMDRGSGVLELVFGDSNTKASSRPGN